MANDKASFDPFALQCASSLLDGKPRKNVHDEIVYNIRFVLNNECNVSSLLKSMKVVVTSKENRDVIEGILNGMVRKGTLKKRVEGTSSVYSFIEPLE